MNAENEVKIKIDGREIVGRAGESVVEVAKENNIYIPTLCDYKSLPPAGTCRVCTVLIGGRPMAACTTIIAEGMEVSTTSKDLEDLRKALIEMLFVEGNHICPICEKSGNCELQALAYRYRMVAPRFPFLFPKRYINANYPHIILEHNRCIQCLRCVRGVKDKDGGNIFGFVKRSKDIKINMDETKLKNFTEKMAQHAMDLCPVGAILKRHQGFSDPIGKRKYDKTLIGSEIEKVQGGGNE